MNVARASLYIAAVAALAACAGPAATSSERRASQETLTACRTRADEVYARQNRSSLYASDNRDSPESGSYNSGITTRGLAERFDYGSQVASCVRNQGSTDQQSATGPGPTMVPTAR